MSRTRPGRPQPSRPQQATDGATASSPVPGLEDRSYLAYLRPTPRPFLHFASGHFPPATVTQPHAHQCAALHGCLQGTLTLCTSQGDFALEAGVFYLLPPRLRHSWRNSGKSAAATMGVLLDLTSPGRWPAGTGVEACCRELDGRICGPHRFATAGDQELHRSFWMAADHLTAEQSRDSVSLSGALLTLLGQMRERLGGTPTVNAADQSVAQSIRRLLLARVRDRLSINQISRESDTSPTRAKELFREAFGCGIMTYFNQLKIWQAKRLLDDRSLTVEQIANELGFSSPSYFTRAFVRHTGQSPKAYRNRNLG